MEFRKNDSKGAMLKSVTLKPGESIPVDIDISNVEKMCVYVSLPVDKNLKKLVIGEPAFRNDTPGVQQLPDDTVR
jgi:hypothetical protein